MNNTVAEYKYDVLGNLVGVATTDESFEILVDGGHSLADVASDGTPLRVYLRGPGVDSWLGFVDMTGSSPVPYFYVTDHLGSVLAVTDANGDLVERYEYDAWGKVLSVTDANGQQLLRSAIGNRILWQAREYSWTTGLYYFRNRWYDPVIGRWISKDPIGIDGGVNLYLFCEGDPLASQDPSGLVHINLFHRTWENNLINNANRHNPPDVFSVAGHGSPKGIRRPEDQREIMPVEELADMIRNHPDFHWQPVQIDACNVGNVSKANGSYAQRLADLLNVEVRAPTSPVCYITEGGKVSVMYNDYDKTIENGHFVV